MSSNWYCARTLAFASLVGVSTPVSVAISAESIEEVVVTGSYIKRAENFDLANPLNVLDSIDIAEQGMANMGDIVKNQTFNYGTVFVTSATSRIFQEGLSSDANLRGLGSGATLTLVNGRRTLTQNVNNLLPQIAISRIETVKDGASAIYGSDAVAGVVNFIPDTNFEGLAIEAWGMTPQQESGEYDEHQWQVKLGTGNETTRLVAAFEYRERGTLKWRDRPAYNNQQYGASSTGNPGTWSVPTRNPDGSLGAAIRLADPGCGANNGPGGTDLNAQRNYMSGRPGEFRADGRSQRCFLEFGEFWDYNTELESYTGWAFASHDLSDNVTIEAEFSFANSDALGRGSPSNPGGRFAELGPIPGDLPGNPWRAFSDLDGDGVIDDGERLFAQQAIDGTGALLFDRFGTPIPARDANGDGIADVGAHGNTANAVVLTATPFDPASGIPFNEDVNAVGFRIQGKLDPIPSQHHPTGAGAASTSGQDYFYQWRGGVRFGIPDTTWSGELFYTHQFHGRSDPENQNEIFSNVVDGINGKLGLAGNEYFNPFATRMFRCVDRICDGNALTRLPDPDMGFVGDPGYVSQFAIDEISFNAENIDEDYYDVVDFVMSGDIFELPAGPLAMAAGLQYRDVRIVRDENDIANACDQWVNACAFDIDVSRQTKAAFGEFFFPILGGGELGILDVTAAVRWEDSGGALNSTDPKVSVRWEPREWIATRASWGTSFRSPALTTQFTPASSFLRPMSDRTCELSPDCMADEGTFRTETFSGNEFLSPETADVWNIGFTLNFLEDGDLQFGMDFTNFDFTDRVARISAPQVIDQDYLRYQAFINGGGTRAAWIGCAPVAQRAVLRDGCETSSIRRNIAGEIIEVYTSAINAASMVWEGFDFDLRYRFESTEIPVIGGEYGSFTASLTGTYVSSFTYKLTIDPNEACPGDGGKALADQLIGVTPPCEAAGNRNDTVPEIPPIPEWKINGRLNWTMGNHSATLLARYVGKVYEDSGDNRNPDFLPAETYFDATYTYNLTEIFGSDQREAKLTIGGVNIFDTMPDPIYTFGAMETLLHDPRGALWYARVTVTM
ncbi:MAG: TonB-dependent receptor domain-containing protein [Pseudomonadota bacterium]